MKFVFLTLVLVILVAGGLWARSTFLSPSVEYAMPTPITGLRVSG